MPKKTVNKERKIVKNTEFDDLLNESEYELLPNIRYYVDAHTIKSLLNDNLKIKDKFLTYDKAICTSEIVQQELLLEALRADNQELWQIYQEVFKIYHCWQIDTDQYLKKCVNLERECQNKGISLNWQTIQELALCIKSEDDWHWMDTVYITSQSVNVFKGIDNLKVENWIDEA
jgi:hypothetical protein